jgi:hypothetical protein
MAIFKQKEVLEGVLFVEFDRFTPGGVAAPWGGIYRCRFCEHEIAIAEGHTLPAGNHKPHPIGKPMHWPHVGP